MHEAQQYFGNLLEEPLAENADLCLSYCNYSMLRRYEKLAVKAMFRKAVCVSVHVVHPLCRVTHHICHAYGPWLVLLHRLRPHCVL